MGIKCCKGCVPPKRTPTCHSTCPEYIREKAEYEAERDAARKVKEEMDTLFEYKRSHTRYHRNLVKKQDRRRQ